MKVFQRPSEDPLMISEKSPLNSASLITYMNKFSLDLNLKCVFYARMTCPFFYYFSKHALPRHKKEKRKKMIRNFLAHGMMSRMR